jgi:DNA-binding response OmpR family regulator
MVGRILVVDEDPGVCMAIRQYLERELFDVVVAASGAEMRDAIETKPIDLVILNLQLPDENGLHLVKIIRDRLNAGILMLTAKKNTSELVKGLDAGADAYFSKPADLRVLLARIRSLLRRNKDARSKTTYGVFIHGWRFDAAFQLLFDTDGNVTQLTGGESRLLQVLNDNSEKPLTREFLHREVFGYDPKLAAEISITLWAACGAN